MMEHIPQITPIHLSNGAIFPVIFYDGEESVDLGKILITPAMNFHIFRSMLSQRIGISHHQFTIYFEHRLPPHHHHRHRHPVTNKFNFASAIPDSPSHLFRVVLKRSRRTRRRNKKPSSPSNPSRPPLLLLRRGEDYYHDNNNHSSDHQYLMSLNMNSDVYNELYYYNDYYNNGINLFGLVGSDDGASATSSSGGASSETRLMCDVCLTGGGNGDAAPFHWCKNDAVTTAFRSPAGPIAPPSKGCRFY